RTGSEGGAHGPWALAGIGSGAGGALVPLLGGLLVLHAELRQAVAEAAEADAQESGGLHLHASCLVEGALEHAALEGVEPVLEVEAGRDGSALEEALVEARTGAPHLEGEDVGTDLLPVGEGDG